MSRLQLGLPVLVHIAFDWHGGGGSPLYRFASHGGVVFDEGHRQALLEELAGCIGCLPGFSERDRREQGTLLKILKRHVKDAKTPEQQAQ